VSIQQWENPDFDRMNGFADPWPVLPPRETLEARLHQSIEAARLRLRDNPGK